MNIVIEFYNANVLNQDIVITIPAHQRWFSLYKINIHVLIQNTFLLKNNSVIPTYPVG